MVDFFLPQGTNIEATRARITKVDTHVRPPLEGVTGTNTVVGGDHTRFMLTYDGGESGNPAYGQILVDVDGFDRIAPPLIPPEIQTWLDAGYPPEASTKVWQFELVRGGAGQRSKRGSTPT